MEQQFSNNLFSSYLRDKYNKALTRFEKGLESGRFVSYSKQKKAQIWNRLNRYAKQLGIALRPGLITACLAAGLCFSSAASAQTFAAQTGAANPLNGIDVGTYSAPTFEDIDGDGDTDAFIGESLGTILYYKNIGTTIAPVFIAQTGATNPFNGVDVDAYSTPTFVDIDGDGDRDAFIGERFGDILYYKNTGTTTAPVFVAQTGALNPFNGVNVNFNSTPIFEDIDGDGDTDAFIGVFDGTINYYKNTGTTTAPVFAVQTGALNPFNGVDVGDFPTPAFEDIDRDGDKDVLMGEFNGTILYYKNIGTTTAPVFAAQTGTNNPLNGIDVGWASAPTFVDIDRDGDRDAFMGEYDGTINYYKNTAAATALNFVNQTGAANPFDGVDVGQYSTPTFVDIDGDGDQDAFSGQTSGVITHYKNTGTTTAPVFLEQTGAANPFNGVNADFYSFPTFVDIDGDGDKDAFIGVEGGTVSYYQNTGTTTAPVFASQTGTNNPLNGVDVGLYSTPLFEDIDGDGDKDVFIGNSVGTIAYYQNTGTTTAPVFVAQTGGANPFNGVFAGGYCNLTFVDIDRDGDSDAFIGVQNGTIKYYQNTGTTTAPVFTALIGANNPFNGVGVGNTSVPTFVDIDGDGDSDAFIGAQNGTIKYYQNTPPACVTPVFALGASSSRCQGVGTISYAATNATSYSLTGGGSSTINTSTGEVIWDAAFSGSATITAMGAGCNATHVVTANPLATAPTITAGNTAVCVGASVTLTAVGAGGTATEFAWFRNGTFVKYDTQPNYTFPALVGPNNYTLVVIYGGSCPSSVSSTATLVTGNAPAAVITPSVAPPYCVGSAPTLMASTGTNYTYSWIGTSTNAASTTGSSLVPNKSGNHRVIVTDANGCSKSSPWMGISLNALPTANAGADKSVCLGSSIGLGTTATAGYSYSWSPSIDLSSATSATPTFTPSANGNTNYTLTVTNTTTGCMNTDAVGVSVVALPATPTLTRTSSPVCQGATITLIPSGATGAINWYKNGVLSSATATAAQLTLSTSTASADSYTIRAKSGTCLSVASNPVSAWIKPAPVPTLSATPAIVSNVVSVCNPGQTSGTAQLMVNLPSGAPTATMYNWQQVVAGTATNVNPAATISTYTAAISATANNKVFRAEVTYSNSCVKNTSNVTVKMLPSTCKARAGQTDDLAEEIFTAYPNPTENVLHVNIQNSTASEGELVLYNTLGQVITSRTITLNNGSVEESLDLSGLASGVYTLSFQTKDGNKVQKIVKE